MVVEHIGVVFLPIFGEGGFRWRGARTLAFLRDIVRPFCDELDSRLDDCSRSMAEIQAQLCSQSQGSNTLFFGRAPKPLLLDVSIGKGDPFEESEFQRFLGSFC